MDTKLLDFIKSDEKLKSIIKELKADKTKTKKEVYKEIITYLATKDINATEEDLEELLKNNKLSIFNNEISEEELSSISGGLPTGFDMGADCSNSEWSCHYSAGFNYYPDPGCSATVEFGSWCGSDDKCQIWDMKYDWLPKK